MAGKSLVWLLLLLTSSSLCFSSELDVKCLETLQQSVIDPRGILEYSWKFSSEVNVHICGFTGVECWSDEESRISSLRLSGLGLQGQFPQGLEHCTSMVSLDLSNNNFSGPIPFDIARQMPYLASLDLSYNSFSGEIPVGISNMVYLNVLNLQHNQLSGQIPREFSALTRLKSYNVADNQELCSAPLGDCPSERKWRLKPVRINDESSVGAAVGFVVGFVVALYFPSFFVCSRRLRPYFLHV